MKTKPINGEVYDIREHDTEFGWIAERLSDGQISRIYSQLYDLAEDLLGDPSECGFTEQ